MPTIAWLGTGGGALDGPIIRVRLHGGDADNHIVDMRQFGEALMGIDRIVSDGFIAFFGHRVPKKGERAPLIIKAREPEQGSVDLVGYLQESAGLLAIGAPIVVQCGADFVSDWFRCVIADFSGRRGEAELAMQHMADMNRDHLLARDLSEERVHQERMAMLDIVRQTLVRQGPAAAQVASPVGRSVNRLDFSANDRTPISIDPPTADALRQYGGSEFGDIQEMVLRTDGFTFHTKRLVVHNPERPGYINALVLDPAFKEEENPYTMAANRKALIRVVAKPGFREGVLEDIYIMDFRGEIDDAA